MGYGIKAYDQQQNWLFPPSIEKLIPEGHPSYHPKIMLKVMVYAYMDNIYSSRKIEKALLENINFMWLSRRQTVDHNTIARFRSNRLQKVFKDIFKQEL